MLSLLLFCLKLLILCNSVDAFRLVQISHNPSVNRRSDDDNCFAARRLLVSARASTTTSTAAETSRVLSVLEATRILQQFDDDVSAFSKEENIGMGGGISASMYCTFLQEEALLQIAQAVIVLVAQANQEREEDYTSGRVKLGICADDCMEVLGTLKSWVPSLKLPRGLLHGMDVDGVAIDMSSFGPAFAKYNTGGAVTFSEMRKMGLGFDAIWKPGDAVLEGYDGDFRGVYLGVELRDGEFRQYGVLPLNLFDYVNVV